MTIPLSVTFSVAEFFWKKKINLKNLSPNFVRQGISIFMLDLKLASLFIL